MFMEMFKEPNDDVHVRVCWWVWIELSAIAVRLAAAVRIKVRRVVPNIQEALCRDAEERDDPPGKVPRQAYGEGPGRKRSGPPSIRSRGQAL